MPAFRNAKHSVLEAVCSRSPERARNLAARHGAKRSFAEFDAMLEHVDAVYVGTPVHCHVGDACRVLEAGKHLLLEKPLARTAEEARIIATLARGQGAFAMEAYMMKFHPAHGEIREAIQAGRLGRVVYARARLGCWYPDLPGAWRQDPALAGGGALMDLGSHLIDLLGWMLGPIRSIKALCTTQLFAYPVEDSATALLEFGSGAHAVVEACFSMPDRAGTGVLELVGTRGRVLACNTIGQDGGGQVEWEDIPEQEGYESQQVKAPKAAKAEEYAPTDLYAAQLDCLSQCILTNTAPEINRLEEGVQVLEWIGKAYHS